MSQIGFVKQEQHTFMKEGKETIVKWFECHFRVGGIRPFSAKMSPNKKKESTNAPDFYIYLRANVNKGDRFRDMRIGALWLKTKAFEGSEKTFMTGNIFMNFQEIPIAVWRAEPRFEGEKIEYLYDISMMQDKPQANDTPTGGGYEVVHEDAQGNEVPQYTDADIPAMDASDEIPF